MHEMGIRASSSYRKSARIVGEVLGKYHPHGDSSVYDTMVRMAQDWSLRYMLVDGQGNYGSIDGDSPAAMRYTEARMQKISEDLLADIDKNTVDKQLNFDDTLEEPVVLPTKIPNLLINGGSGIAVGMATNMPPHNLVEVVDGIVKFIDNVFIKKIGLSEKVLVSDEEALESLKDKFSEEDYDYTPTSTEIENRKKELLVEKQLRNDIEELIKHVKAPDFPTGGVIYGYEGVKEAFHTGRGRVVIRGKATIEEIDSRECIVVTEIPYQVNKAEMIKKTAELINEKKIEGISNIRDESDRKGLRIVYILKRDAIPNIVLNKLYKFTPLQSSFSVNNIALVNGRPRLLNLKDLIHYFVEHRHEVVVKRTEFELKKAEDRAHILEGMIIASDNIDEVINIIRKSKTPDEARENLCSKYNLTEIQSKAIVEMRLDNLLVLSKAS